MKCIIVCNSAFYTALSCPSYTSMRHASTLLDFYTFTFHSSTLHSSVLPFYGPRLHNSTLHRCYTSMLLLYFYNSCVFIYTTGAVVWTEKLPTLMQHSFGVKIRTGNEDQQHDHYDQQQQQKPNATAAAATTTRREQW